MRACTFLTSAILAASVATPCTAAGPGDGTRAEQLHKEGITAIRHADFEKGRKAFAEAYALDARPEYLWDLGLSEMQSDHPADGLAHLRRYFVLPSAKSDDPKKIERVRTLMAEAEAKTGHLKVSAPAGSAVSLDGALATLPEGAPLDVMPGKHLVEVRPQGSAPITQAVEAHAGETLDLRFERIDLPALTPEPAASVAPSVAPAEPVHEAPAQAPQVARYAASGAMVGTAAVAFVLGGVFLAKAGDDQSREAQARTMQSYCAQPPSTPSCITESNAAHDQASHRNIATGLFVGGSVLAVAGVATWLLWPRPRTASASWTVVPVAFATGGGVQWAGSFQ